MRILLVNDDGFDSALLRRLCMAANIRGHRVLVAAPAQQQSAKAHSFTIFSPLLVRESKMEGAEHAWIVDGTPVDCTRVGLLGLAEEPVDIVISGINNGWNVGLATWVSGTVGAAREAAFLERKALAVSMEGRTPEDTAGWFADYAIRTAEKLIEYDSPRLSVCNLNAPAVPLKDLQGVCMAPLSTVIYKDGYDRRVSPRGDLYFWVNPMHAELHPEPGTDQCMLDRGWATITFITPEPCDQNQYRDFPLPIKK